jgi:hypothetical protein
VPGTARVPATERAPSGRGLEIVGPAG